MKMIPQIVAYLLPYKGRVFLALLCNMLYAIFSVASLTLIAPFLQVLFGQVQVNATMPELQMSASAIIDFFYYYLAMFIETRGELFALLFIAITMVSLSLLTNFFRYMAMFCLAYIRAHTVKKIRKALFCKLLSLDFSTISSYKKGDLMNRLGSDVQEIEWSVFSSFQSLFRDPVLVVVFVVALCNISLPLTLFSFTFIPFAAFLIGKLGKSIERNSKKLQVLLAQISSIFDETIGGLKVIKGYNAIDYAKKQFQKQSAQHNKVNKKIFRIQELAAPLTEFLSVITMLLVLLLGGKLLSIGNDSVSADVFVMYIVIFARTLPPIKQFVTTYYVLQKGTPSLDRVQEILNTKVFEDQEAATLPIKDFTTIEFKDLSFYYVPDKWVLKNVNLKIKKGDKLAIVGASGSGKSTLVDLLPGFYEAQQGEILIDGIPLNKYKKEDLRTLFAWVSQDVVLFHDTVYHNLTMHREGIVLEDVQQAARAAHAEKFILEMKDGWETMLGDRGMNLSGGQRQRLSIARALLQNSPCLILDEATSALDKASEQVVQKALNEASVNKTTITITHRFEQIKEVDAIYFIEDGKIVESGKHTELLARNGRYARYYFNQEGK